MSPAKGHKIENMFPKFFQKSIPEENLDNFHFHFQFTNKKTFVSYILQGALGIPYRVVLLLRDLLAFFC